MTDKEWKIIFEIIVVLGLMLLGFYMGRKTVTIPKNDIKIEYIKGDTLRDTIWTPKPYKVVSPIDTLGIIEQCIKDGIYAELWPTRTEYIEVTKSDTTDIMKDWATKRYYNDELFNSDTLGTCIVNSEVQYNRLKAISYEFTPITKTITETKYTVKTFSPFVSGGFLINPWDEKMNPMASVSAGMFFKDKYGLNLQYQHAFSSKNDYIGISGMYKF